MVAFVACALEPARTVAYDSIPPEIAWVALVVDPGPDGRPALSPLMPRPGPHAGLSLPALPNDGAVVRLLGFGHDDLDDLLPDDLGALTARLEWASPATPTLPTPRFWAEGRASNGNVTLTATAPIAVQLTAPWITRPSPCAPLETTGIFVPALPLARGLFGVRVDVDVALIGMNTRELFRVTSNGAEALPWTLPLVYGAVVHDDGTLVMVAEGAIYRSTIDTTPIRVADVPWANRNDVAWVAGDPTAGAEEIFAATSAGALHRYDGNGWQEIYRVASPAGDEWGSVAWLAPGHAMAAIPPGVLVEIEGGVARERFAPDDGAPRTIALLDGLGLVLGTQTGALYLDDGAGGWTQLRAGALGDRDMPQAVGGPAVRDPAPPRGEDVPALDVRAEQRAFDVPEIAQDATSRSRMTLSAFGMNCRCALRSSLWMRFVWSMNPVGRPIVSVTCVPSHGAITRHPPRCAWSSSCTTSSSPTRACSMNAAARFTKSCIWASLTPSTR